MCELIRERSERLVKGGLFLAFEGIHGCGKSTQIGLLVNKLENLGFKPEVTKEVEGTPLADQINKIAFEEGAEPFKNPIIMSLLIAASRASRINNIVKPSLDKGKIVLADRSEDTMWVYQHRCEGVDEDFIKILNQTVMRGIHANTTFLLDLPIEIGLQRRLGRAGLNNLVGWDARTEEFHRKSREAYLELAKKNTSWVVLDGMKPKDDLFAQIYDFLIKQYLRYV